MTRLLLEQHYDDRQGLWWQVWCPNDGCAWDSGSLPFPTPDAALHCLSLHSALCGGTKP